MDDTDRADATDGLASTSAIERTDAPDDRPHEVMDARRLPPPQPLQGTIERLGELDDEVVLLQRNDRAPQHLYPLLSDRGYAYETVELDEEVVTAIWRP